MKKILYSFLIGSVCFTGCKKEFLETAPSTSIDAKDAFSTQEKAVAAMNGLYNIMKYSQFTNHIMLTTDVKGGDMLVVSTGNYSRFVTEYRFLESPTTGYHSTFWANAYELISNCNQAIVNIPNSPLPDAAKKEYLAEARAIRAWTYHELIRLFGQPYSLQPNSLGVPKVEVPLSPTDKTPERATVKEIYNFILTDLLFAKDNVPASRTSLYKINQKAVNGLLARVYLDMEDWPNASAYAKLAHKNAALPAGSELLKGFVDPTSEWVWALNYRSDDNSGYLQVASFMEPYDIGYSTFRATKSFFGLFNDNDIRKQLFYVNETMFNTGSGNALQRDKPIIYKGGYLMNKFYFRSSWDCNLSLMRAAELYLVEAEAEAELGHDGLAQDALFVVQKRAITGAAKSANTGAALKQEIQLERRKELFGEGFRFFDILRRKETLTRTAADHWSEITLEPGNTKNVMPIPQSEIEVSGIKQNPGYN